MGAMLQPQDDWRDKARCKGIHQEAQNVIFYPSPGQSTRQAKAICKVCPVQEPCLDYAMTNEEHFGIWGGLTEAERRRLKRQLRDQAAEARARAEVIRQSYGRTNEEKEALIKKITKQKLKRERDRRFRQHQREERQRGYDGNQ